MKDFFKLERYGTDVSTEIVAGLTTFLTISYILSVNPLILKDAGMPFAGVFIATGLSGAVCTLISSLYANVPFACAPAMGLNSLFAYTMCQAMGFHWREALAATVIAGVFHLAIALSPWRKSLVAALPEYLRFATSGGIGLFISYIGLKNSGLLIFSSGPGTYTLTESGTVIGDSYAIPSLVNQFSYSHLVFGFGLAVIIFLLSLEKRTGDKYGAFILGIISATFIGIPLSVTDISEMRLLDFASVSEIGTVAFSFFSDPGLFSLLQSPERLFVGSMMCLLILLTNMLDSAATILGCGQLRGAEVFRPDDLAAFRDNPGVASRLDRALIANSACSTVSGLLGSSSSTVYIESVTGIAAGGRTGLTSLVISVCFFLCVPLIGFFRTIPAVAIAPALIISGVLLLSLASSIRWERIEEAIPAGLTIIFIPLTYNILNGVAAGLLSHIIIQCSLGKRGRLDLPLLVVSFALTALYILRCFL